MKFIVELLPDIFAISRLVHDDPILTVALAFTALLSPITFAAAPVMEPTGIWSGKFKDETLRRLGPSSGFVGDVETWKRLWTAWRTGEELPEVDFAEELVLVGTVSGPNLVMMRLTNFQRLANPPCALDLIPADL